jgi:hypothetical protein
MSEMKINSVILLVLAGILSIVGIATLIANPIDAGNDGFLAVTKLVFQSVLPERYLVSIHEFGVSAWLSFLMLIVSLALFVMPGKVPNNLKEK